MSWSKTDTGIAAGSIDHLGIPTNFATTEPGLTTDREQWRVCREAAARIIQSGVISKNPSQKFTISLSGTSTAGHQAADTITIVVTNAG